MDLEPWRDFPSLSFPDDTMLESVFAVEHSPEVSLCCDVASVFPSWLRSSFSHVDRLTVSQSQVKYVNRSFLLALAQ